MALSLVVYPGLTGLLTDFAVPFDYISRDHVFATVNGVTAPFTWLNNSTIRLDTAPDGDLQIHRQTPKDEPVVVFSDGSVQSANVHNIQSKQMLFIAQETSESANPASGYPIAYASPQALKVTTEGTRGVGSAWKAGPFTYVEVPTSEPSPHFTTDSGIKLNVVPEEGSYPFDAFLPNADGVTSDGALLTFVLSLGSVRFGPHTYLVNNVFVPDDDLVLLGVPGTVLRPAGGVGTNSAILSISAKNNVRLEGITFDGNMTNHTTFEDVVKVVNSHYVTVTGCKFRNTRGAALTFSGCDSITVRDNTFNDIGLYHLTSLDSNDKYRAVGVTGSTRVDVSSNLFDRVGLDAIYISLDSHLITVSHNIVGKGWGWSIYVGFSKQISLVGNKVSNTDTGGNGIIVSYSEQVSLSSNVCSHNGASGILIRGSKFITLNSNVTISNNLKDDEIYKGGLTLAADAVSDCENVSVTGHVSLDDAETDGARTQLFAIGIVSTDDGVFRNITVSRECSLVGYNSSGVEEPSSIFERDLLGATHYPLSKNVAVGGDLFICDANDFVSGSVSVYQRNTGRLCLGYLRQGDYPKLHRDDLGYYLAQNGNVDPGTAEAILWRDTGTNKVYLRNYDSATRFFIVARE